MPGQEKFLKRQEEAKKKKQEKIEAEKNLGRVKREVLFDIELNFGNRPVLFTIYKGQNWQL